jgi:hypothetical protein
MGVQERQLENISYSSENLRYTWKFKKKINKLVIYDKSLITNNFDKLQ